MGYQEDYDGDLHKSYQDQIDNINYLRELEADRIRNETNNIIRQQEAQKPVLKQRFTDNAQDAYIRKMKSQKELPQILSAQGYNGGLTESSNIKLDADYGNSYNGHQRDYNTGLREVDSQINTSRSQQESMLAQNSSNYGQMISNANATYQQALAQAKREQRAQELQQQQYQQEFAYKQQQDKIKNDLAAQKAVPKPSLPKAYKPTLTPAQIDNAIKNGNTSKNVLEGYKHYYGEDYRGDSASGDSASGGDNDPILNEQDRAAITFVNTSLRNGSITYEQAEQILRGRGLK